MFYPLAGRLGLDGAGRVQVDCTGEGVVFVTARSEHYALEDLMNEFVPCGEMRDLLVPPTPAPNPPCALLFVQVTRLGCGGVVLGQAMHHSGVDARGAALFFETWASISRGAGTPPVPSCFDHTLLAARPAPARAVLYDHPEYKPEPEPVDPVSAPNARRRGRDPADRCRRLRDELRRPAPPQVLKPHPARDRDLCRFHADDERCAGPRTGGGWPTASWRCPPARPSR